MPNALRLFETRERASLAVEALRLAGFADDQISLIVRDAREASEPGPGPEIQERNEGTLSAWSGGMIGGTAGLIASAGLLAVPGIGPLLAVGPLLATLGGGALGASLGGLVGESIDGDDQDDQAKRIEEGIRRGDVLVAVDAPADRFDEAGSLLDYYAMTDLQTAISHLETERRFQAETNPV